MDFKNIQLELEGRFFTDDLLERIGAIFKKSSEIERIIVNGTCTIVFFKDGRKTTSNVHDEEFDAEKGVMMCIIKGHGVTHGDIRRVIKACDGRDEKGLLWLLIERIGYERNDIKELVKSTKYQGMKSKSANKIREVERVAKKGEYVRMVENYHDFKKGQIVKCITECDDKVNLFDDNNNRFYLYQKRYVVLKGYKSETK